MSETYEILCGNTICGEADGGVFNLLNETLAPLFLVNGGRFSDWVEHRAISESRGLTARNLKSASGIPTNASLFDTAMRSHAAAVTDNFWVRKKGEALVYEDVSFDRYDGFFYRLSIGIDSGYEAYRSDRSNPELTNIGNSDKAWFVDEDKCRYLYKRQPLYECFHEIAASLTAEALGIPTVRYELIHASEPDPEFGRTGIIRSADFTWNRNVNLEHADGLLQKTGASERDIRANAEVFSEYGLEQQYLDLKYFDVVVGNPDRHLYNYGVLRDRVSGKVLSLAPNYDNNFAFTAELPCEELLSVSKDFCWTPPVCEDSTLRGVAEALRATEAFSHYKIDEMMAQVRLRMSRF